MNADSLTKFAKISSLENFPVYGNYTEVHFSSNQHLYWG